MIAASHLRYRRSGRRHVADDAPPPGIDASVPNPARMYDYFLGGKNNYAADREAAERVLRVAPEARMLARRNRAFLRRAVRHLVTEAGIRQFVDIGTGLPAQGGVHEVAHELDPTVRVAYVDHDPVVLAHARALLSGAGSTVTVRGDLRRPEEILADPGLRSLIDLSQPVAILLVAVVHFLSEADKPAELVARLRDAVVPGSHLVLSHVTDEERGGAAREGAAVYRGSDAGVTLRSRDQIQELFDGCEVLDPGLVPLDDWRPDDENPLARQARRNLPTWFLCGVGRIP
ncbi:SAM-dependent methyltransferase [Microbispora triticiradicis]|uniref:SAM-dependent methyltransferase n=3 Tax=Microbispora TaxID=2005 RepID=A0ABY3LUF0_9ACTN|nr:SAM-dependent methyltransferase [Microbispora triticiradicis]TLP66001.1 SAM-dependent methyltransferase [Microbispora fusca]TYB53255.1 SAM-dependent methyltransferase [Microbispora tritici]